MMRTVILKVKLDHFSILEKYVESFSNIKCKKCMGWDPELQSILLILQLKKMKEPKVQSRNVEQMVPVLLTV